MYGLSVGISRAQIVDKLSYWRVTSGIVLQILKGTFNITWKRLVIISYKLLLYFPEYFLFPLFKILHIFIRLSCYNSFNLIHIKIQVNRRYLVVNPISFSLMEGLYNPINTFILSIAVVLKKLREISTFEVATHPVFLFGIF